MRQLLGIFLLLIVVDTTSTKNETDDMNMTDVYQTSYFISNRTVFTGHSNEEVTLFIQFCRDSNDNVRGGNISVVWSLLDISLHQGARYIIMKCFQIIRHK